MVEKFILYYEKRLVDVRIGKNNKWRRNYCKRFFLFKNIKKFLSGVIFDYWILSRNDWDKLVLFRVFYFGVLFMYWFFGIVEKDIYCKKYLWFFIGLYRKRNLYS